MSAPLFPNPLVMETDYRVMDDAVTETEETRTGVRWIANPVIGPEGVGWAVGWVDSDDTQRGVILSSVEDQGDQLVGATAGGQGYRFRALDPYDAVQMSAAGVPQPLVVVQAEVMRGGVVAQELDAVYAADNTVATLMLETGLGTFVRYSGDWQLMQPGSAALDDLAVQAVGPAALAIWDAADAAGQTISIFDLPMPSPNDDGTMINPEESTDVETAAAIAASGVSIPQIKTADDLDLGIRYGETHPSARWYVTKRARALAASARIPAHWNVVTASAAPPFPQPDEEMPG